MGNYGNWQTEGLCRRCPPEVFYPEDGGRIGLRDREARAKKICQQCPVMTRCRDHALRARERYGVWGALTSSDRARVLRIRGLTLRNAGRH